MSVTIKDIARVCGVSYSTVSRVLNGKNIRHNDRYESIIATAHALGYKPHYIAKQLVEQKTDTIGLLIPDIANPHYPEITKNVQHFAEAAGYQILLFNTDWDVAREYRMRDSLLEKRVAGIIVMPVCDESHSIFRGLDVPVAFLGTRTEEKAIDYVVMDNVRAAFDATEHLISCGRTNLAYIGRKIMNYTSYDRAQGFLLATQKHNIPETHARVIASNSFQQRGGYSAMRDLLQQTIHPDGVLVFNDLLALGAMIGKDRSTVYRYERGDIESATIDVVPKLARALQTTPQHMMGWDEKPAFYWIDQAHLMKLSERAEQWLSWTLGYSWTEEEFELFGAQAKYIQQIKGIDKYDTMLAFLATFYEQLNQ